MFVVDIILKKDRGELKNCVIFDGWGGGLDSVKDPDGITEILNAYRPIMFQNIYCNGKIHTENIKSFEVKEVSEF